MIKCAESVKKDRTNALERTDFLQSSVKFTDRWKAHGQQELASGSVAALSHCRLITPPPLQAEIEVLTSIDVRKYFRRLVGAMQGGFSMSGNLA